MKCAIGHQGFEGNYCAVVTENSALPLAVFSCEHCAKDWGKEHFPHGYNLLKIDSLDSQLISNLFNKVADVVVVHGTDYSTTAGALHKHDFEI